MKIIPVIDLKSGEVVHARRGARDEYRPVVSALCAGSRPLDVIGGFLAVHPFDTLYIADLDAIQRRGDNGAVLADIRRAFPQLTLWVDSGLGDVATCRAWLDRDLGILVLGSEALVDTATLHQLHALAKPGRLVLSLDFRGERFLGPPELLDRPEDWPERIIVMTLSRVGSGAGPDLAMLEDFIRRAPGKQIFAAGGVRGGEDLLELADRGLGGVLIATALHDRRIGPVEIAAVASRNASM
jgi:phosphoribosylformimino-5-aminoimidazole carboxamide ribotide isomerase